MRTLAEIVTVAEIKKRLDLGVGADSALDAVIESHIAPAVQHVSDVKGIQLLDRTETRSIREKPYEGSEEPFHIYSNRPLKDCTIAYWAAGEKPYQDPSGSKADLVVRQAVEEYTGYGRRWFFWDWEGGDFYLWDRSLYPQSRRTVRSHAWSVYPRTPWPDMGEYPMQVTLTTGVSEVDPAVQAAVVFAVRDMLDQRDFISPIVDMVGDRDFGGRV